MCRHSSRIARPPARWIAPSTPPPPMSDELAALTIASTGSRVMSPRVSSRRLAPKSRPEPRSVRSMGATGRRRRERDGRMPPRAWPGDLLAAERRVLGGLGNHELQAPPGRDLDLLAG